jgi:hypothetical protein
MPYAEIPFGKDCVAEIWLGPTLDQQMARRTWEIYLAHAYGEANGKPSVAIHLSKIPLRGSDWGA